MRTRPCDRLRSLWIHPVLVAAVLFLAAVGRGEVVRARTAARPSPDGPRESLELSARPELPLYDCNVNGIEDAVDIALGTSFDANKNGIPDECDVSGGAPRTGHGHACSSDGLHPHLCSAVDDLD